MVVEAYKHGQRNFGENYVSEFQMPILFKYLYSGSIMIL